MSSNNFNTAETTTTSINKLPQLKGNRIRKISRTDSEIACEETASLTAEQQEACNETDVYSYCDYHDLPPPPDGGYGWVVVFASFMCNLIVDGIAYTFGIFHPEIALYYNSTKGKTAWVGSMLSGMYLMVGPLVSALTNKFGCRTVCIAGSVMSSLAFVLSTFCPTVQWLMLIYGVVGGIGFGLIYLPAVVCVGYYFETKRSLATGIAVCGSGVGTFAFAPLATFLLEQYGWKGANLVLAGLILNCVIFGALMRPLVYPSPEEEGEENANGRPLLQRMAEERRIQMERGSIGGSYFMVQLPDGTMEKRMKQPINIDPGVHSSLNLDQLAPGTPITPIPTVPTLPTIAEAKATDHSSSSGGSGSPSPIDSTIDMRKQMPMKNPRIDEIRQEITNNKQRVRSNSSSETTTSAVNAEGSAAARPNQLPTSGPNKLPRNASQPAFSTHMQGIPKNGSVPTFDRIRKTSLGGRFRPTLGPIRASSRTAIPSNNSASDMKRLRNYSNSSFTSRNNNSEVDVESLAYTSKLSLPRPDRPMMVRPLSRKDIFYSGSVVNLPEFHQSQKSLTNYRQSIMSIPRPSRLESTAGDPGDICPCLVLPESFTSALSQMMDMSLIKNPVFFLIGVSNVFGMAGLYVPFFYLVDSASQAGIESDKAPFLLSIIGITNTFGRVACGYFADFPAVNSLLVNNVCLVVSAIAVTLTPFCSSYGAYITMAVFFGFAVSGYISLTSIILVDLLGVDKLTNAFGLLILFRGAAAIVGSPLAGALYDVTKSYDIPFYVAGGCFAISALTSFIAPCLKPFAVSEDRPMNDGDVLTPIDEDDEEEDGPILMQSPSSAQKTPPTSPVSNGVGQREIKQIESVL